MCVALVAWLQIGTPAGGSVVSAQQTEKAAAKDSPAAEHTRMKLLKTKVTVDFKNYPLREALKEFAAQVEMQAERPVMWTYPEDIQPGQKVTYSCNNKPLDAALGELCTKLKLGYVVVSGEDDPRDGWVRVTAADDEKTAATRLAAAKEHIEKGKKATARAVLNNLIEKYPKTKAATEAKAVLEKLDQ